MIYLSIKGRLGNQMFQYAFARALQEQLGQEITIDWHFVNNEANRMPNIGFDDSLKLFRVKTYHSVDAINYRKEMTLKQYLSFRNYEKHCPFSGTVEQKEVFEKNFLKKHPHNGLFYFENGFYDFDLTKPPKNLFLTGYFESTRYFSGISEQIREEFVPVQPRLKKNTELYDFIESQESVCVSMRYGNKADFIKSSFHGVCTLDYFLEGMDIIKRKNPSAVFIIFSDNVEQIKKDVKFNYPVLFEEGTDPVWEKLRLMSSCKHFIISNSTFSWWAQYLSRNPDKIVIAPDKWYNSTVKSDLLNDDSLIKIVC